MEKCSDFLFGPVGHNEMRLGPVCSAAKSCITKHSLTADLIVCRRHCAKTGSYIFAELATDHWSSAGTFSLQMLCLCLKTPRNESHLYNFYSVSSIKVRICGQEYETRLLSRQKWKQWKSKRRNNDCSFNCLKSLWANVIIPSAFCWDCRISRDYCSIFYVFFKTISNFWVLSIFYFLYLENITIIKLSDKIINIYLHKNMLFMFIPSST